jgi:hypothetical protein
MAPKMPSSHASHPEVFEPSNSESIMSTTPKPSKRPDPSKGKTSETQTEAGQEPIRGQQPTDRDRTHQSNYGGGGENGGQQDDKR